MPAKKAAPTLREAAERATRLVYGISKIHARKNKECPCEDCGIASSFSVALAQEQALEEARRAALGALDGILAGVERVSEEERLNEDKILELIRSQLPKLREKLDRLKRVEELV